MKYITLLFLILCFVGCAIEQKPVNVPQVVNKVKREKHEPIVPHNDMVDKMIGKWYENGELSLIIEKSDRENVVLEIPENEIWSTVVNNIRWQEGILKFNVFMYYEGSETFEALGNGGDHPYSGIMNQYSIVPSGHPNRLDYEITAMAHKANGEMVRK